MRKKYSVSYYVEAERYWQFAGEFHDLESAYLRAQYLEDRGQERVRIRNI